MIVTQAGKWNERDSGGSVIPVAACAPMVIDDVGSAQAGDANLLDTAIIDLPTDGVVSLFASARETLQ